MIHEDYAIDSRESSPQSICIILSNSNHSTNECARQVSCTKLCIRKQIMVEILLRKEYIFDHFSNLKRE